MPEGKLETVTIADTEDLTELNGVELRERYDRLRDSLAVDHTDTDYWRKKFEMTQQELDRRLDAYEEVIRLAPEAAGALAQAREKILKLTHPDRKTRGRKYLTIPAGITSDL